MKKVRIKTEGEFLKEFGYNWIYKIDKGWNSGGKMDFLYGMSIDESYLTKQFKDWEISQDMVTRRWAEGTWIEFNGDYSYKEKFAKITKTSISCDGFLELEFGEGIIENPDSYDIIWHEEEPSQKSSEGISLEDGMILQERIKKAVTEKDLDDIRSILSKVIKPTTSKDFDGKNFYDMRNLSDRVLTRDYPSGMLRYDTPLGGGIHPVSKGLWNPLTTAGFTPSYKDMFAWRPPDPLFKKPHKVELKQKPKKERKLNLKFK